MNRKSCTTQLVTVYDAIGKHLDEDKQTDLISLDFSKAFDSQYVMDHNMLIYNLHKLGFSGKLLLWINDYLKDRSQRVVLDELSSRLVPVTSGVPQGSILGSFLFLLFKMTCQTALYIQYCPYSPMMQNASEKKNIYRRFK